MLTVRALLCAVLGWFAGAPGAQAQMIIKNLGPQPIIAGVPMTCGGALSYVAAVPDIAIAQPGALMFRPDFFSLPPFMQWFVYAHECAHQVVGSNEQAADCWAIKLGRNQGFINAMSIQGICAFTFPSPGDWTHLPGPARCQQMLMCFTSP